MNSLAYLLLIAETALFAEGLMGSETCSWFYLPAPGPAESGGQCWQELWQMNSVI